MARLLGNTSREVQRRRLEVAREMAATNGVYVVLKGAQTLVAGPGGQVSVNSTGNPVLASGGTGDVLTGLIGGFLAQGLPPWDAARLGVYLHGLAGDYLVETLGPRGHAAGDLLTVFPDLLAEFIRERFPVIEDEPCLRLVIS
jgi:NAD(P)H-hydrate epimerase